MTELTHIDKFGNAEMVDVTTKKETHRSATAKGEIQMHPETMALILKDGIKKGDVLSISQLAGIMGAKRTPDLIPLCHPINLSSVKVYLKCNSNNNSIDIEATCKITGQTGVEMEALTAVSIAALTVYDMCKAADKGMQITNIRLTNKTGGKSGVFKAK